MRKTIVSIVTAISLVASSNVAFADTAKPGASMTHMKTAAGVASTLEAAGVILYVQGGATSAVIGYVLAVPRIPSVPKSFRSIFCPF